MMKCLGGKVERGKGTSEFGKAFLKKSNKSSNILDGLFLEESEQVWMSHGDHVSKMAEGFDAILPNPNFVGGRNTYWIAQAIPLAGTGVQMVNQDSVFPSLRSSKAQGQANFVNPGINIYNIGMDLNFSPKIFFN